MTELALAAPTPAAALERLRADLVADLDPWLEARLPLYVETAAVAVALVVADPPTLAAADALLNEVMKEHDGLEAVREAGPGALGSLVRVLNAKFKPLRDELEKARDHLKAQIGAYAVAQRAEQVASYQAAAAAHVAGEHSEAAAALAAASAADTATPQGTNVREVWAVKRIALDLLPREWMVADEARIDKLARETPIDETPIVPGVIFEKVPHVTKRRK